MMAVFRWRTSFLIFVDSLCIEKGERELNHSSFFQSKDKRTRKHGNVFKKKPDYKL